MIYILSEETKTKLEDLAKNTDCCNGNCLRKLWKSDSDFGPALDLLKAIHKQISAKSFGEKRDFLRTIIIGNNNNNNNNNSYIINLANNQNSLSSEASLPNIKYFIGFQIKEFQPIECCVTLFRLVYDISHRQLRNLRADLKLGNLSSSSSNCSNSSSVSYGYSDKSMISANDAKKVAKSRAKRGEAETLSLRDMNCLTTPNSFLSKLTSHWMEAYFNLVGDHMPNKGNEIHLETIEKRDIWQEYVNDCAHIFKIDHCMGYTHFIEYWNTFFKHVKIREYKAVSGKCYMCSILSSLRKKFVETSLRGEITELHALHRITYMSERRFYYARIMKACEDSYNFLSLIGDGMAENHTALPWLGNLREAGKPLNQHLQGILVHGKIFRIFRSFPFTSHNSNLACYCFLATLEFHYKENNNKLPDTIYYQVDGGSENSNMYLIALCELLIIRRLTKRIYLSRLPVGHTHEDIDSKFGRIWKYMRTTHQYTPKEYEKSIRSIFGKSKLPFEFHDYFVVPDYKRYFMPYANGIAKFIDPKFSSYAKEELTQLAWKFVATKRSPEYPLGCKTNHRPYFSDVVYEIIPDISGNSYTGYKAAKVLSDWMPKPSAHNPSGGMYILKRLPNQPIYPAEFSTGGQELLTATVRDFMSSYGSLDSHSEHKTNWLDFTENVAPKSDDVYEYIASHLGGEFHIPFQNELFPQIDIVATKNHTDFNGYINDSEDEIEISEAIISTIDDTNITDKEFIDLNSANDGDIVSKRSVVNNMDTIAAGESVVWGNRGVLLPLQKSRINVTDGTGVLTTATTEQIDAARLKSLILPRDDYSKGFLNHDLAEMCKARGLKKTYKNKKELIDRLKEYDDEKRDQHLQSSNLESNKDRSNDENSTPMIIEMTPNEQDGLEPISDPKVVKQILIVATGDIILSDEEETV